MKLKKDKSLTFKAAILAVGKTVKRLIGTISILVLVRLLSKEDFGTYRQVLFIIGMAIVLVEFAIPKSLFYFVPKAETSEEKNRFISQSYLMLSVLGISASIILFFGAEFIGVKFNNDSLVLLLKIYAPVVIFLAISQNFFSSTLISLNKHTLAAYSYVFVGMPNTVAIIIAAFVGFSLNEIFSVSLFVIIMQYLILFILFGRLRISLFQLPKYENIKEQFKYVLPLSFALISGLISVELDRLVISMYFSAATFAIYSVGAMQVPLVGNLFEGVSSTVIPKIAQYLAADRKNEIEVLCNRGTRKMSLLLFPIFCFLFVHAKEVITLLYTDKFVEAVPVFRIYLLLVIMKISFCGNIIMGSGKTNIVLKATLITLSLNLLLNFIFVKYLGFIGPAIATIGSRLLHQTIFVLWVTLYLKYKMTVLFPIKTLLQIFLISLLSSLAVYPISILNIPKILSVGFAGISFLLVYILMLSAFKILLDSEKEMIKDKLLRVPVINQLFNQ